MSTPATRTNTGAGAGASTGAHTHGSATRRFSAAGAGMDAALEYDWALEDRDIQAAIRREAAIEVEQAIEREAAIDAAMDGEDVTATEAAGILGQAIPPGADSEGSATEQEQEQEQKEEEAGPDFVEMTKDVPSKEDKGWRHVVRHFTPSWFAVNMGTGIVSILLHNLPWNVDPIRWIAVGIFCLNIILFCIFTIITLLRYIMHPEIWEVMIKHPSQSLFLGCIPMGLATIINMIVFVCEPWGPWVIYVAWGLWWFDVALASATCLTVPFIVVHHHKTPLHQLTATLLLPIVPAVVASATGGIVAAALPNRDHAITTLVAAYIIWGLGESFSFFVMTIYLLRLQIHDLPPREAIVSVFLPIGPLGQGGYGIQQLGHVALTFLPRTQAFGSVSEGVTVDPLRGGEVLYTIGILLAFFLWGCALGWLCFALISIFTTKHFSFNMGWWGFTFPLGVFTTCTSALAQELSSTFFKVLTMIFSGSVTLLWMVVSLKTIQMALTGEIFYAPCLKDLRPRNMTEKDALASPPPPQNPAASSPV